MRSAFLRSRTGREYTLFELLIAGAVVLALIGIFLANIAFYQEQAERTAVRSTIAALQTAMALRAASILAKESPAKLARLQAENPMDWLAEPPANYAGAFLGQPEERIKGGGWYYDRKAQMLVYQVWRTRHFEPVVPGQPDIRLRVVAEYGEAIRLHIGPDRPYRWFDED